MKNVITLIVLMASFAVGVTSSTSTVKAQTLVTTELVSVASDGTQSNNHNAWFKPSISADGRYVAFHSNASNLVDGDTNGWGDIFVHDRDTGQTTRVSVASDGTQGNDHSDLPPSISADGRYVAFYSKASNLVSGDTNNACDTDLDGVYDDNCHDVFVHDQQTGETTCVSIASDGTQGNQHSFSPSISADGRYVAFHSNASNLVDGDTNGWGDIFVHDRDTGQTTRVSVASDGTQGNGGSGNPTISADGRYVVFESNASNLVDGDTNGWGDIFVHDRDTGQTTRVSVASDGTQGNDRSHDPTISADGRYVAFDSLATNLVDDNTNNDIDVFIYDRQTGETTRVAVASDGSPGDDDSAWPSISADGRYVAFFSAASNLISGETFGSDIFVYDRASQRTIYVSVASDGGPANDISTWPSISADGRYVAFNSEATNLVDGDTNNFRDVFVAKLAVIDEPCTLPAFADTTNGNPIQQHTDELHKLPSGAYGGMELDIAGKGRIFLHLRTGYDDDTIYYWGCKLISGAMVINYYAALQGSSFRTDPVALNDWMAHNLTNNNSGYGSGNPLNDSEQVDFQNPTHVAWGNVPNVTLVEYALAHGITNMALDSVRGGNSDPNDEFLTSTMCSLNPGILAVASSAPGGNHFVVASGNTIVNNIPTWRIHNSLAPTPTDLFTTYQNQYKQMIIFKGVDKDAPRSRLLLALYSPAELLVTDPQGRRIGLDPRNNTSFEEIPSSYYGLDTLAGDGDPGQIIGIMERKELDIAAPVNGEYLVEVIGTGNGSIGLEVVPVDDNGNGGKTIIADTVAPGVVNTYRLTYSSIPGQPSQFVRLVDIDIKPGSDPNSINCTNEDEVIAVAILTTETFDATTVDHTTVTFEGASEIHVDKKTGEPRRHEEDVDNDGDTDLVFHFRLGVTDLTCESTEGILTGETFDGQTIKGTDAIRMIDQSSGQP